MTCMARLSQKTISNTAIVLQGHYEPQALEENLTEFGIEVTSEQIFTFNKSYIEKLVGRPLIPGDILQPSSKTLSMRCSRFRKTSSMSTAFTLKLCRKGPPR